MNARSIKFFAISFSIIVLTLIISILKKYLVLDFNPMYFALAIIVAFGISIAGASFGVIELKEDGIKVSNTVGLLGNFTVIILFIWIVILIMK